MTVEEILTNEDLRRHEFPVAADKVYAAHELIEEYFVTPGSKERKAIVGKSPVKGKYDQPLDADM